MSTIEIEKIDAVYMQVHTDKAIMMELQEHFSFKAPNYQFHPKYKQKMWDGYIRLITSKNPRLYVGLLNELKKFCEDRKIKLKIPRQLEYGDDVSDNYGYELAEKLKTSFKPHDYQNQYIVDAIRDGRSLNISPTSSGKSFIQYLIAKHYILNYNHNILIVVPRIQLTKQMKQDFVSYGCDPNDISILGDGVKSDNGKKIVVGTWQTLIKMPESFYSRFDVLLGDEAHTFESKSLIEITGKMPHVYFRHGFTGTISSDSKIHQLCLEGLFGGLRKYVSTADLIDNSVTANLNIKMLYLNHTDEDKKEFRSILRKAKKENKQKNYYPLERNFLNQNIKRNNFIKKLVWSLNNQNNIIFFDHVETHGEILAEMLKREGRIVYFIHGGVSSKERERIRNEIENDPIKRYDIVASSGTTSTGVSIKRIDNAIFTSGSKGEIKTLQSIGRLLRKGNGSDDATLFDIGDNLSNNVNGNYSSIHFVKRMEIYENENFKYKVVEIDL